MKWAFVDYENFVSLGKVDLSSYARVTVFLGAKQPKLYFTDTKYDRPINLVVVQLKAVQANNLDFHLAYYLGKFDSEAPADVAFGFITDERGFTSSIGYIKIDGKLSKETQLANNLLDTRSSLTPLPLSLQINDQ